jgi:hypothetical protein
MLKESPMVSTIRTPASYPASQKRYVPGRRADFRKHSAEIGRLFADANPKELQILETVLKKAGKSARALAEERSKTTSR